MATVTDNPTAADTATDNLMAVTATATEHLMGVMAAVTDNPTAAIATVTDSLMAVTDNPTAGAMEIPMATATVIKTAALTNNKIPATTDLNPATNTNAIQSNNQVPFSPKFNLFIFSENLM